jgi:hypothetical protein
MIQAENLTKYEGNTHELFAGDPIQLLANIHDTVNFRMIPFRSLNHVVTLGDGASNADQAENTRNETKCVKRSWKWQHIQTDPGLDPNNNGAHSPDLLL